MRSDILRDKIEERGIKLCYVAKKLELSNYGFSLKINGKREFKWSEIEKIVAILDLNEAEKKEIFFKEKSDLNTHNFK